MLLTSCAQRGATALLVDGVKRLGFLRHRRRYRRGDGHQETPAAKAGIIAKAEDEVEQVDLQFRRGLITDDERYLDIWTNATDKVTEVTMTRSTASTRSS